MEATNWALGYNGNFEVCPFRGDSMNKFILNLHVCFSASRFLPPVLRISCLLIIVLSRVVITILQVWFYRLQSPRLMSACPLLIVNPLTRHVRVYIQNFVEIHRRPGAGLFQGQHSGTRHGQDICRS
jgi:hypothetical protein